MKYFKKIIKNKVLISLVITFVILVFVSFLFFKYFDSFLEAKFNLTFKNLNAEYLKSNRTSLDTEIFSNEKFKLLKINKIIRTDGDISIKSNPFESYGDKEDEEEYKDE